MFCAMDHDFGYSNLTPSVTLRCNIPNDMSGSFFSGGVDGFGQIFLILRDSIFDGLRVIDHCAQLCDTLQSSDLKPTALASTFKDMDLNTLLAQLCWILIALPTPC